MQRITLLCVGRIKTFWLKEGCEEYTRRLGHSLTLEIRELPAGKASDAGKQRRQESDAVVTALKNVDGDVWLLDEKGERMTSQEFSFLLSQARDSGRALTFVLCAPCGSTPGFKKARTRSLRVSDMTLPHELCRLVFLEQLYRAVEIGKGSGYHHA